MSLEYEDEPRAYTVEEMRQIFIDNCKQLTRYWAKIDLTRPEFRADIIRGGEALYRIEGFLHSMLVMFDGGSELPAFDIVPSPHEDNEAYCRINGGNWWTKGVVINECQLHEMLYQKPK